MPISPPTRFRRVYTPFSRVSLPTAQNLIITGQAPVSNAPVNKQPGNASLLVSPQSPTASVSSSSGMVTNVTGTVSQGSTLTITGTTLIDQDKTNWTQRFKTTYPNAWSFEGSDAGTDGYNDESNGIGGVYQTSTFLLGTKAQKFSVSGASDLNNQLGDQLVCNWALGGVWDAWYRVYVRYHKAAGVAWPDNHCKFIGVYNLTNPPDTWLIQPDTPAAGSGDTIPRWIAFHDSNNHIFNFPGGAAMQQDRWYCLEVRNKFTSPCVLQVYVDGVLCYDGAPAGYANTPQYFQFGVINASTTTSGFSMDVYCDGITQATARPNPCSIIEISNSTGFATKVYQAPIFLSDTSCQVKCDLTGLGAGPYFLRVTNNKGVVSNTWNL